MVFYDANIDYIEQAALLFMSILILVQYWSDGKH